MSKAPKGKTDLDQDHEIIARSARRAGEASLAKVKEEVRNNVVAHEVFDAPLNNRLDSANWRYSERVTRLLWIIQSYAPTLEGQQKVADAYNQFVAEHLDAPLKEGILFLTGMLANGLLCGTWPWNY